MTAVEEVACPTCGATEIADRFDSTAQLSRSRETFSFVRCARCDLVRLSPRPRLDELGRWYDDYLLHAGARAWGRFAPFVERANAAQDRARVRTVLRATKLDARSRVLDFGCGRPTFVAELSARTSARCTGVDLSDAGWRDEPERFRGIELQAAPLADARLEGPFDLVTGWHALEHDPSPREGLAHLLDLTRPGGHLVVEVPNFASLTARLQGSRWAGLHTPRHMVAFTPETLRNTLESAGWRVDAIRRWGTLDPWVLFWLGRVGHDPRLAQSLERRFVPFVAGKVATFPIALLQRVIPLGVMTAVAHRPP